MALSVNTVLEVRTVGSDTNGGGFVTGSSGTDWSQQTSPQYSVTDGVTAGTTTITSATANFGTDVVGNLIYVQGGTGSVTAGWYQITSRTNATTIVVDRSTGLTAGTGVTLKIGGALATPGLAASLMTVSGMKAYIKSGTYNLSTATPGAGGPIQFASSISAIIEGYQTTRGDRTGTTPIISWASVSAPGAQTFIVNRNGVANQIVMNITVDGNNVANVSGFSMATAGPRCDDCRAQNCSGTSQVGFSFASVQFVGTIAVCNRNFASNCKTGFASGVLNACTATGCTTGFTGNGYAMNCLAYSNTGVGFDYSGGSSYSCLTRCTSDGNSGDGFKLTTLTMIDCCSTNNGGYGYNTTAGTCLVNCASKSNTSGRSSMTPLQDQFPILLTADPYVSVGSDFRPNATAGGGALLRAAGFGVAGQTNNRDVGSVQHSDAAGGGIMSARGFNGGIAG